MTVKERDENQTRKTKRGKYIKKIDIGKNKQVTTVTKTGKTQQ